MKDFDLLGKLLALGPQIHQTNLDKGFWEKGTEQNLGEKVGLAVGEMYEAVEAHRKKHWAVMSTSQKDFINGNTATEDPDAYVGVWNSSFKQWVKDTVQDEIADTLIRLLDFVYYKKAQIFERDFRKPSTGNFCHDVLRINKYIIDAFDGETPGRDWGYVFAAIFQLWNDWADDLSGNMLEFVRWKMQYNSGHPFKHNKEY